MQTVRCISSNVLAGCLAVLMMIAPLSAQAAGNSFQASSADASYQPQKEDPWQPFNRKVYAFNEFFDKWFMKPVAKGYRKITPQFLDKGVTHFFDNLSEPLTILNALLQFKGDKALISTGRFLFNSTLGVGGFFDVATSFDFVAQREDFGQTLGYWGLGSGPFLMLPFLGPSDVRDAFGLATDYVSPTPWYWIHSPDDYYLRALEAVDKRADLIPAEGMVTGDRYSFLRNAYLQRRNYLVHDGHVQDPFTSQPSDEDLKGF